MHDFNNSEIRNMHTVRLPKTSISFLAITLAACATGPQILDSTADLIDPSLSKIENEYIDGQSEALLEIADKTLVRYPPQFPEPTERRLVMFLLDGVFHDVYAPSREPVQEYFHARMRRAIQQIEATTVEQGAMIWKLYNHAFVVRTPTVTIAFDLTRARLPRSEGFGLPDDLLARLTSQCDALFISHRHGDHADEWVAQAFLDQGKPVVAPPEVWLGKPIHQQITHLKRESHRIQSLMLSGGKHELQVIVYPGHQGAKVQNNVPLVITPEGLSFAHFGDQRDGGDDFGWIDQVGNLYQVDVLLPNSWTSDIARAVRGFDPELVITGHENEMGHTIDHREPYWITYERKTGSDYRGGSRLVGYDSPLLVMTWGEFYHYRRSTNIVE